MSGATINIRKADGTGWERRRLLQRNAAGTGWAVIADALPSTNTTIDDSTLGTGLLQWEFSAGWSSGGGNHWSAVTGATATLRFTGNRVIWRGALDAHHGIASVTIDEVSYGAVDCYAATRAADSALFDSGSLADTTHTVIVTVTGNQNADSSGVTIAVDSAQVANTGSGDTSDNPFAGKTLYVNPYNSAKNWVNANSGHSYAPLINQKIANQAMSQWINGAKRSWDDKPVRQWVSDEATAYGDKAGIMVLYYIPIRDLNWHSGGGAADATEYRWWINEVIAGLAGRPTIIILEPDALASVTSNQLTTAQAIERKTLLKEAVYNLTTAGHYVYTDVGNVGWHTDPAFAASLLREVDAHVGRGFALNVANFYSDAENATYGNAISAAYGGTKQLAYVVDSGRNANGNTGDTLNPFGAGLGWPPGRIPDHPLCDGYVWIKDPGSSDAADGSVEADGSIAPAPGVFWPAYAYRLANQASW